MTHSEYLKQGQRNSLKVAKFKFKTLYFLVGGQYTEDSISQKAYFLRGITVEGQKVKTIF